MTAINPVTDLTLDGDVAVITLNSPPVNALSAAVRQGLFEGFKAAIADPAAKAIVLTWTSAASLLLPPLVAAFALDRITRERRFGIVQRLPRTGPVDRGHLGKRLVGRRVDDGQDATAALPLAIQEQLVLFLH